MGPAPSATPAISVATTSAGRQPPNQRPTTIVPKPTGESHVNGNVPARMSAPSTASPITRQVSGRTRPNNPSSATSAKASWVDRLSAAVANQPNSTAPAHGSSTPTHRLAGRQARSVYPTTATNGLGSGRPSNAGAAGGAPTSAVIAATPGRRSRTSGRAGG